MTVSRARATSARRIALTMLGLAVSAVALAVCLRAVDLPEVVALLGAAQPAPLVALLVVLAVQTVVRAYRWSLLLPRHDGRRIPVRRTLPPLLVGYLGNAVLPARLGEPARALILARRERVPGALSFGSVVLERVVDMAVLALLMVPAAWVAGGSRWILEVAVVAGAVAGAVLVILAVVGLSVPARWLAGVAPRLGGGRITVLAAGVADRLVEFAAGAGASGRRPVIGAAAVVTACAWLMDGALVWLAAASLGISLDLAAAIVISGVAVLGTAVPSAPGYIGTFELAASAAAVALGVDPAEALALAILVHAMVLLPIALAGVGALLLVQREGIRLQLDAVAPAEPVLGRS